jgi:hypothetical protein
MTEKKNAFDWRDGTPSIWSRDKELKMLAQGRAWGQAAQAKIGLQEKQQITVYSRARLDKQND